MKEQLKIAGITILIFVAGVLTGIWTQHSKTPPPPPFGHMGEFDRGREGERGPRGAGDHRGPGEFSHGGMMPPEKMEEMRAKMEKLKPQMEEFHKKFDAIREKSKSKMVELLREDQKKKFDEIQSNREQMIHEAGDRKPFGKEPLSPMVRHFEFLNTIIYKPLLERMTQDLNLDANQKKSFEEILVQRRKDVLDLLDTTPPPSIDAWGEKPHGPGSEQGPGSRSEQGPGSGPEQGPGPRK